jgi:hypothetical protein
LQALPSAQDVPASTLLCVQPAVGLQPSAVQGLASLQLSAVPRTQAPAPLHISVPLQRSPSRHEVWLFSLAC